MVRTTRTRVELIQPVMSYRIDNDPRGKVPRPAPDPSDRYGIWAKRGPGCSVLRAGISIPPCGRCYALLVHGMGEPLPEWIIPRCHRSRCILCRRAWPALEMLDSCLDLEFCDAHILAFCRTYTPNRDAPPWERHRAAPKGHFFP
jgi:hypothetical protein